MTFYENGLKWTGSLKRRSFIRLASERTAWAAQRDLRPPDRRRRFVWLAVACMAYPIGASLPLIGLLVVLCCGIGVLAFRLYQVSREAGRAIAGLRAKSEVERLRSNTDRLTELSVREERSRIVYEIHDVVGHTLTAAIVQLESTRRMAEQQSCVPPDKLELVTGLVRKGLDDIRRAVKQIRADEVTEETSLETALRGLIHAAEHTMEIVVEADISLPPKSKLGRVTEQMLYHALLEGLTNGIRHGRCERVSFSLHASDGTLRFLLVSDGEPFGSAVPGFGLSSMIERVKLLGGEVEVQSSADANGNPVGCELSIELPLAG